MSSQTPSPLPAFWHARFRQQAAWTLDLRRFLYDQVRLRQAGRVLEVGSGTGVITAELGQLYNGCVVGLDLDLARLAYAHQEDPRPLNTAGDGCQLPFYSASMDITLCHFLLLWVKDPLTVLLEMRRVTRPGGAVLALAEPDYGGRIDFPWPLAELGRLQAEALAAQGSDTASGRKLSGLFHRAGFTGVQTGLLGGQWSRPPAAAARESEWAVLQQDLAGLVPPDELARLLQLDHSAWQSGERVLFVPTFYAFGFVPAA